MAERNMDKIVVSKENDVYLHRDDDRQNVIRYALSVSEHMYDKNLNVSEGMPLERTQFFTSGYAAGHDIKCGNQLVPQTIVSLEDAVTPICTITAIDTDKLAVTIVPAKGLVSFNPSRKVIDLYHRDGKYYNKTLPEIAKCAIIE